MLFKNLISSLESDFNDRPDFKFGNITDVNGIKQCIVRKPMTPYTLTINEKGVVLINGGDTDGFIYNFNNYDELSHVLLLYVD